MVDEYVKFAIVATFINITYWLDGVELMSNVIFIWEYHYSTTCQLDESCKDEGASFLCLKCITCLTFPQG